MKATGFLLIGGGAAALVAGLFVAKKKSDATTDAIKAALAPPTIVPVIPGQPPAPVAVPRVGLPTFEGRITGYWPFQEGLSAAERKMEGAPVDRKGAALHTVEDFLSGKSDHVSVSGDYEIFPYGQKISIPWGNKTLIGRITDTGGHFHGINKIFRVTGREPLDFCILSSKTPILNREPTVTLYPGDNFAKGAAVATSKFKDQTVAGLSGVAAMVPPKEMNARIRAAESLINAYYASREGIE